MQAAKRFAQAMGATITTAAATAALGFTAHGLADGLLATLLLAAGLESILAFCVGCQIFKLLMRAGLVPVEVCAECADIRAPGQARRRPASSHGRSSPAAPSGRPSPAALSR